MVKGLLIKEATKGAQIINTNGLDDYYKIYSEIYGIIFGYMLPSWSRGNTALISYDDYYSISEKDRMFYNEDCKIIYEIAKLYYNYCKEKNLSSYNEEAINILYQANKKKYDYVFIDEVQDLTECQIKMLYSFFIMKKI